MKTRLLLFGLSALIVMHTHAQSAGDYRSKQTGNWNDAANWETFNGTNWVAATNYPTATDGELSIIATTNITCNVTDNIDQLTIEAGGTLTIDNTENFNLTAGPDDDVDLKIYGTLQWNKGWAGNCGTWEIYSGGIANINCGSYGTGCNTWNIKPGGTMNFIHVQCYINGTTINNEGTINFTPDWENMYVRSNTPNSPGTIHNKPNGTVNMIKTGNNGRFGIASDGNNGSENYVKFINEGTLNLNEGTELYYGGPGQTSSGISFENTGTINIANNAMLSNAGIFNFNGGNINGTGNALIRQIGYPGIWKSNVPCNLPVNITFELKTQLGGPAETTINGKLRFEGRLSNRDYSEDIAKLRLSPTGTAILVSGYLGGAVLTNEGVITMPENWGSGLNWEGIGKFINKGLLKLTANQTLYLHNYETENGDFINEGVVEIGTGGNLLSNTNSGQTNDFFKNTSAGIIKGNGYVQFDAGFSNNGAITPGTSPGILQFNGAQPLSANSTLEIEVKDASGAGTGHDQLTRSGDLTLAGKLEVISTGNVPDGSYMIISLSSGTISGSFSELDMPLGYTLTVNSDNVVLNYASDMDDDGVINEEDCAPTDATKWQSATLYIDADGDGYDAGQETVCYGATVPDGYSETSNGEDCNDDDANVHSSQPYYADNDGDGFGDAANTTSACSSTPPSGYVTNNTDCDDNDNTIYPGAPELPDGKDNDCDGETDEGAGTTWYEDADGDGFGNPDVSQIAVSQPEGYVADNTDCDDTKLLYADNDGDGFGAGSPVACGVDNDTDCDDNDDTKWQSGLLYIDFDSDNFDAGQAQVCYGAAIPLGYNPISLGQDCNDHDMHVHTEQTYYADYDGDGFGDPNNSISVCEAVPPMYYVTDNTDCNDNDNTIYPGAPELPDGKDNDCDGETDEGTGTTWYEDADGDGFGNPDVSQIAVSQPEGYVADNTDCDDTKLLYADNDGDGFGAGSLVACGVDNNSDCNDNDATIYPGAPELCDGKDNNCDGTTDEGCGITTSLRIDGLAMREGNSGKRNLNFVITLNKKSNVPITVKYRTTDGSATAPADYVAADKTITIPANTRLRTINIAINGDKDYEPNETVKVELYDAVNATIAKSTAVGYILNDDRKQSAVNEEPFAAKAASGGKVTLSPNPASNIITLSGISIGKHITVSDIKGRTLITQISNASQQKINISNLAAGTYIVRYETEDGSYNSLKFIKQ